MSSAISAAEPCAVLAREPRLLEELVADLGLDALANRVAVGHVEEPRPELADEREVDPVLELRERVAPRCRTRSRPDCRRRRARDALVELHRQLPFRSSSAPPPVAVRERSPAAVADADSARASAVYALAAFDFGSATTIGCPLGDRTRDRPVAADEHVGLAAEQLLDVGCGDADVRVRTVEHQRDARRVVAHLRERLEPDLRVLERERVEHPDDAELRGGVDRRDHLGRESRRRVDDDEVVPRARRISKTSRRNGDPDRGRLVGPQRREQRARPGRMLGEEPVDLVAVERSARDGEVVDRLVGCEAEREPDVAELQVEVDDHRRTSVERERHREVATT